MKNTKACLMLAIKYVDELQDFWDNILETVQLKE